MILGETAGAGRFRSRDAYARFSGTAPIPVWSGRTDGEVRLNRGGNRTINTALHMIAVIQSRGIGPGRAYLDKLTAAGKTRTEALRLLRRRLSDAVFSALRTDEQSRTTTHDFVARPAAAPVVAAWHRSIAEIDRPHRRSHTARVCDCAEVETSGFHSEWLVLRSGRPALRCRVATGKRSGRTDA